MRQVFFSIFLLLILSCKTTKQINVELFTILEENAEYVLLKKEEVRLNNDSDFSKESCYSIKIPNSLKKSVITITEIPNKVEFIFNNQERIIIVKNTKEFTVENLKLNKEHFLVEAAKLNLLNYIDNLRLKDNRFFIIKSNMNYFLLYINIEEGNLEAYNNSLKSHEIFP